MLLFDARVLQARSTTLMSATVSSGAKQQQLQPQPRAPLHASLEDGEAQAAKAGSPALVLQEMSALWCSCKQLLLWVHGCRQPCFAAWGWRVFAALAQLIAFWCGALYVFAV
jgi:hypothetical protein